MTNTEPAPTLPAPLTREAVALGHHRLYCLRSDRSECTEADEYDYNYADMLAEILELGGVR